MSELGVAERKKWVRDGDGSHPGAEVDRPGLRKGQGPACMFTGHQEKDRTRATVPRVPSDTASLSDLGTAVELAAL